MNARLAYRNHSGVMYSALAAATMGIEVLEVHVTLSREMFGPDVASLSDHNRASSAG